MICVLRFLWTTSDFTVYNLTQFVSAILKTIDFFGDDGFLLTVLLNFKFEALIKKVLHDSEFWKNEPYFEVVDNDIKTMFRFTPNELCKTLKLKTYDKVGPNFDDYFHSPIFIDIVPCIRINV